MKNLDAQKKKIFLAVFVAALGYFVDIYDLLLFSIVRMPSLRSVGVPENQLLEKGVFLINSQMAGLFIGGLFWGILGDKKGRLSVLFGSIFIYSIANILNGFAGSVETYAALRFIAGFGLAGELGAGITLVSELMDKNTRGYGTCVVAAIGLSGGVFAAVIGDIFAWRTAFIIGGVMGLCLLVLRVSISESGMFKQMKDENVEKGNFFMLFRKRQTAWRYFCVVAIGVPIWYVIGILITFSPEFGKSFGMSIIPSSGKAVMFSYIGIAIGDFMTGLISQWLKSRKKVFALFIGLMAFLIVIYFNFAGRSLTVYYTICFALGLAAGYWAIFVTVAAEQFGTNIRSTVASTAPNFVRGCVIPLTMSFQFLQVRLGIQMSAVIVGSVSIVIALICLTGLHETFGKDLSYNEV